MSAPDSHQNTRNLKLDLDLLNKVITEHLTNNGDIFVVQNLNQVVLAAGFIRFTRAIEFFDERVEKKGSTDKEYIISHGTALAAVLLLIMSGEFQSLLNIESRLNKLPFHILLDLPHEVCTEDLNRHVCARALEAFFDYDCRKFFAEFALHCIMEFGIDASEITELHIDSTTYMTYHMESRDELIALAESQDQLDELSEASPDDVGVLERGNDTKADKSNSDVDAEASEPEAVHAMRVTNEGRACPRLTRGVSKDHRDDLNQYTVYNVTDGHTGVTIYSEIRDGNASDAKSFAEIVRDALPSLKQDLDNLRYIVGDSKLFTEEALTAASQSNTDVITRMPANFIPVKEICATVDDPNSLPPLYPEDEWKEIHGKSSCVPRGCIYKGLNMWGFELTGLLVYNKNLIAKKKHTFEKKAKHELAELKKQLKQTFKCVEDAKKHFASVLKQAYLCDISEPEYEEHKVLARRGPKSKDPAKNPMRVDSVKICAEVSINHERLIHEVEEDCLYLIVTTDVKRDWVPHELLEAYRRNAVCERLWRQTKCKRMFLERFFLKNEWRLEALLCLVQIACLAQVLMENKIRQGQAEHRVWIPDPEHKELETKSTYRRTSNYFKDNGPKVVYYNDGTATVTGVDQTILSVLACLGNEWLELILSDRYRIHIDSLPRMRLPTISVL